MMKRTVSSLALGLSLVAFVGCDDGSEDTSQTTLSTSTEEIVQEEPAVQEEENQTIAFKHLSIKKTLWTKSYNEGGDEVTDNSIKDDGYYQKGLIPDYTRASDIVTDELTHLMWQDDEAVATVEKQWLTDENYNTCKNDTTSSACFDTSGDTAATYCSNLSLGGYKDWRLSTREELESIVDYTHIRPSIDIEKFQNTGDNIYWSTTTTKEHDYEYLAWSVDFFGGRRYDEEKDSNYYIRCVREGE